MKLIYRINRFLRIPGLPIAKLSIGRETCILRNDGWVIISDGKSTDAMPISFCSQSIVDAFTKEIS